ncbi:hypothetical protein RJ639_024462 [Escallonia herrerae]|uniref:Uncharacterized protein n=1 Tax=Escallonia herrerae TaxID=1293975 RepID=A0AA88V130_9ASTE|nr:hypothetical protein RJ639_024462 [Escallonia herrerae]
MYLKLHGHDSSSSSSDSDDGDKKGDKKSSPLKSKVYGIFGREKPGGKPADVFMWRDKKILAGLLGGVTAIWSEERFGSWKWRFLFSAPPQPVAPARSEVSLLEIISFPTKKVERGGEDAFFVSSFNGGMPWLMVFLGGQKRIFGAGKGDGLALGIDLGTTYSCVSVWQHDRVEIIANDQGHRTTPSYVAFNDSERLIGDAEKNQVTMNPITTIFGKPINELWLAKYIRSWGVT